MMHVLLDGTKLHIKRSQWAAILLLVSHIQLYDCTKLIVCPLDYPVVHGLSVYVHNGGHLLHRHPVAGKDMTMHKCMHGHRR